MSDNMIQTLCLEICLKNGCSAYLDISLEGGRLYTIEIAYGKNGLYVSLPGESPGEDYDLKTKESPEMEGFNKQICSLKIYGWKKTYGSPQRGIIGCKTGIYLAYKESEKQNMRRIYINGNGPLELATLLNACKSVLPTNSEFLKYIEAAESFS